MSFGSGVVTRLMALGSSLVARPVMLGSGMGAWAWRVC